MELLHTKGTNCVVDEPPDRVLYAMALKHMKGKLLIGCKGFATPKAYMLMRRAPILGTLTPARSSEKKGDLK